MQRYSDYQPTGFDPKGIVLSDQQDWLVLPCGRNRDSMPLDESNFAVALKELGDESDTVEVHRFGHWACGWFEIIIVKPDTSEAETANEIENSLADYPVLDDCDYSEREDQYATEVWNNCFDLVGKVELCQKYSISIFAARHSYAPDNDNGSMRDYLTSP